MMARMGRPQRGGPPGSHRKRPRIRCVGSPKEAKALETVDGNEKAKGALSMLSAQIGELEGILKPAAHKGGRSQKEPQEPAQQQREWPKVGDRTESGSGKGGRPGGSCDGTKGEGKGVAADVDRNDQSAQHKWARRGARRGRSEGAAQGGAGQIAGDDEMEGVEGPSQAEAADRAADAAAWEAKRQKVLDRIRGRLQQEKNRKAAELQAKAIEEGSMPEPHLLSKEQMEENQRRMEATNREVDEEAEKELAAMSSEQLAKVMGLMEDEWKW